MNGGLFDSAPIIEEVHLETVVKCPLIVGRTGCPLRYCNPCPGNLRIGSILDHVATKTNLRTATCLVAECLAILRLDNEAENTQEEDDEAESTQEEDVISCACNVDPYLQECFQVSLRHGVIVTCPFHSLEMCSPSCPRELLFEDLEDHMEAIITPMKLYRLAKFVKSLEDQMEMIGRN
jgi:hypothetical protein